LHHLRRASDEVHLVTVLPPPTTGLYPVAPVPLGPASAAVLHNDAQRKAEEQAAAEVLKAAVQLVCTLHNKVRGRAELAGEVTAPHRVTRALPPPHLPAGRQSPSGPVCVAHATGAAGAHPHQRAAGSGRRLGCGLPGGRLSCCCCRWPGNWAVLCTSNLRRGLPVRQPARVAPRLPPPGVAESVVEYARAQRIDLAVLGCRGMGALQR
jgi:hypothetical protein